eukprot:EG_transcript_33391
MERCSSAFVHHVQFLCMEEGQEHVRGRFILCGWKAKGERMNNNRLTTKLRWRGRTGVLSPTASTGGEGRPVDGTTSVHITGPSDHTGGCGESKPPAQGEVRAALG